MCNKAGVFKLKSILISESYKRTSNHFFYLMETNHKWNDYNIDFPTISNWKVRTDIRNPIEAYSHYILFYLQNIVCSRWIASLL